MFATTAFGSGDIYSDMAELTAAIKSNNLEKAWNIAYALKKEHPDALEVALLCRTIEKKRLPQALSRHELLPGSDMDDAIYKWTDKALEFYSKRGFQSAKDGDLYQAEADFDREIRISGSNEGRLYNAYYDRGRCEAQTIGNIAAAIKDFKSAISACGESCTGNAANALAWILATSSDRRFRDSKGAIMYGLEAVHSGGGSSAYDTLAAAYAEAGDFEKAVTWEEDAIDHGANDYKITAEDIQKFKMRLKSYENHRPYHEAIPKS
ncbi:MAG: hypothetical protein ACRD3W_16370 [Terriglobales bacterium]